MNVQKQLICLEDIDIGVGTTVQTRDGVSYELRRVDLVPAVAKVSDLSLLSGYTKAKVGLVNYVNKGAGWEVDPIPLSAISSLGTAASRNATGPGDLMHRGFSGIGGAPSGTVTGLPLGLQASYISTIAAGGPVDEGCTVLTLPGPETNLTQLAISVVTGAMYVRRIGSVWQKIALEGSSPNFNAVTAESMRANSIGTPKE